MNDHPTTAGVNESGRPRAEEDSAHRPGSAPASERGDATAHYVIAAVVATIGVGLIAGGRGLGSESQTAEPIGPSFFPAMLGALLLVFAVGLAVAAKRNAPSTRSAKGDGDGHTTRTLLLDCGLLLGYGLVLEYLGYVVSTLLYMLVALTVIRSGRLLPRVLLSVVFVVGTYILFDLVLTVRLPRSLIPGLGI